MITEGNAEINGELPKKIDRSLPVFYNPAMKLNRDLSILFLRGYNKPIHVGLPLAASGVRGIRMLRELPDSLIQHVAFNDMDSDTFARMKKNIEHNLLSLDKVSLYNTDARNFMLESTGFDYIDIDPFGSPAPFLDTALLRLSRGGILAVTATDTAALSGSSPRACRRRYDATPLKSPLMHEIGLRILISHVQHTAMTHGRYAEPVFSYSHEHYMRTILVVNKSKQLADQQNAKRGFFLYCLWCGHRESAKTPFNSSSCPHCQKKRSYAGPLWLGQLWDPEIVKTMAKLDTESKSLLNTIHEESGIPALGFYCMHAFGRRRKHQVVRKDQFISEIKKQRFQASSTHFSPLGIRTTAPLKILEKIEEKLLTS